MCLCCLFVRFKNQINVGNVEHIKMFNRILLFFTYLLWSFL